MKFIQIHGGQTATVDDKDYNLVSAYKWYLDPNGYALANIRRDKKKTTIKMHRMILSDVPQEIDHINRNKLDNRRSNLRPCSRTQNRANIEKYKCNTSGYKGVYKNRNGWIAKIAVNSKDYCLGTYKDKRDAALAYNAAALYHFGEFACINSL